MSLLHGFSFLSSSLNLLFVGLGGAFVCNNVLGDFVLLSINFCTSNCVFNL